MLSFWSNANLRRLSEVVRHVTCPFIDPIEKTLFNRFNRFNRWEDIVILILYVRRPSLNDDKSHFDQVETLVQHSFIRMNIDEKIIARGTVSHLILIRYTKYQLDHHHVNVNVLMRYRRMSISDDECLHLGSCFSLLFYPVFQTNIQMFKLKILIGTAVWYSSFDWNR